MEQRGKQSLLVTRRDIRQGSQGGFPEGMPQRWTLMECPLVGRVGRRGEWHKVRAQDRECIELIWRMLMFLFLLTSAGLISYQPWPLIPLGHVGGRGQGGNTDIFSF